MIAIWMFIGVVVGLLLGLTGAGGAIVAVPLFAYLAEANIRDATTLSLLAVMSGSVLNWILQKRNTDYFLALLIFAFSTAGSLMFKPVKAVASEWAIVVLFISVALASLVAIWRKPKPINTQKAQPHSIYLKASIGGMALGALVTMTGLGGGVLLVPLLKEVFALPLNRATATSLLTILLSSVFSFVIQFSNVVAVAKPQFILALTLGSIASALITAIVLKKIHPERIDGVRKLLVTIVVLMSALSLLLK